MRISLFTEYEENMRVYRFLASQLAARREFDSYSIEIPSESATSLVEFLCDPDGPRLLEDLFLLTEGFRTAVASGRQYPGLAKEQRHLMQRVLDTYDRRDLPSQSKLIDALYAALLCERRHDELPPWLKPIAAIVTPCVAPLYSPVATANDSLAIALQLC